MNKKLIALSAASMAAMASAAVNTSIWFDGSNQQVNTGGDCVYEYGECEDTKMGYWYDYDDRKNDNGDSYAMYPFEADQYDSYVAPMIENLGYVAFQYNLVKPTKQTAEYPYNFVGFGFNTVDGDQTPMDISGAAGLCATYTADHAVTLEVDTKAAGSASCSITLPKAASPSMVSKTIADFKQPTWADAAQKLPGGCADAFAAAGAVKFKMDGQASAATGTLRVFEVGPAGTCTGAGAVSSNEPAAFGCKSDGQGAAVCSGAPVTPGIKGVKAAGSFKAIVAGRTLSFSGVKADASFEVVSLQGQVVKSGVVASSVSLSDINAGVYMVRVAGKSVNMSQKIIVK